MPKQFPDKDSLNVIEEVRLSEFRSVLRLN